MTFTRLIFARFLAVVLFVQGVGPAFLFGVWRADGWLLACLAVIYTLLAAGVWQRRRWALPMATAVTLPQLAAISSSWFSWYFYVFAGYGLCVEPRDTFNTSVLFGYRASGCSLYLAFGYSKALLAHFAFVSQPTFVLINALVVPLLGLLLIVLVSDLYFAAFPALPNHTLQRTQASGQVGSEFQS